MPLLIFRPRLTISDMGGSHKNARNSWLVSRCTPPAVLAEQVPRLGRIVSPPLDWLPSPRASVRASMHQGIFGMRAQVLAMAVSTAYVGLRR